VGDAQNGSNGQNRNGGAADETRAEAQDGADAAIGGEDSKGNGGDASGADSESQPKSSSKSESMSD
jgi:hypothetical protein